MTEAFQRRNHTKNNKKTQKFWVRERRWSASFQHEKECQERRKGSYFEIKAGWVLKNQTQHRSSEAVQTEYWLWQVKHEQCAIRTLVITYIRDHFKNKLTGNEDYTKGVIVNRSDSEQPTYICIYIYIYLVYWGILHGYTNLVDRIHQKKSIKCIKLLIYESNR